MLTPGRNLCPRTTPELARPLPSRHPCPAGPQTVEKQCMHYTGPQVTAAFVPLIVDAGDAAAGTALDSRQHAAAGPPKPPKLTVSQQGRLKHAVQRLRDMFDRLERQPTACAMRILVFYEVGAPRIWVTVGAQRW